METIYFYSHAKKYFEFSNFSFHPIVIAGKKFLTNEHYFQSVKFGDVAYREEIRLAETPRKAKELGSSRKYKIVPNWDEERIAVMKTCVRAKFTQHKELKEMLLSTGVKILVEDSPRDDFWGCGKHRNGKNMLGKILMEIRDEIRNSN